jgi:hypothetical protein
VAEIWDSLEQIQEDHDGFPWTRGFDPFNGGPVGTVWAVHPEGGTTGLPGSIEVSAANARLIAAAPDLLAACEKAEAFDWKSGEGAVDVYESLRSAINKAKGVTA